MQTLYATLIADHHYFDFFNKKIEKCLQPYTRFSWTLQHWKFAVAHIRILRQPKELYLSRGRR